MKCKEWNWNSGAKNDGERDREREEKKESLKIFTILFLYFHIPTISKQTEKHVFFCFYAVEASNTEKSHAIFVPSALSWFFFFLLVCLSNSNGRYQWKFNNANGFYIRWMLQWSVVFSMPSGGKQFGMKEKSKAPGNPNNYIQYSTSAWARILSFLFFN